MSDIRGTLFIFNKPTADLSVVRRDCKIGMPEFVSVKYDGDVIGWISKTVRHEDNMEFEAVIEQRYLKGLSGKELYISPYVHIISRHRVGCHEIIDALYLKCVNLSDKKVYDDERTKVIMEDIYE